VPREATRSRPTSRCAVFLATWLMHCAGRYRDGLPGSEDILAFVVNDTLAYLDWSVRNESLLTERLVRWVTGNDLPA
jgi:hypothetical protein